MNLINVISSLTSCITSKQEHAKCISTLTCNTAVLHGMENHVPGFKAAMETFDAEIIELQTIINMLKVIERGYDKKRKLNKSVDLTTESVHSTTDLVKIRQENKILKLKLEHLELKLKGEQSLQTDLCKLTDCRQELSKLQRENEELKCSQLEPTGITDNTYTSMTIRLLTIGKCTNTDFKWNDLELRTLILALQLPLLGTPFIQLHCLPRKCLQCCPSHDHSYLILTFFFFRSF